jgi:hypothetical protein
VLYEWAEGGVASGKVGRGEKRDYSCSRRGRTRRSTEYTSVD